MKLDAVLPLREHNDRLSDRAVSDLRRILRTKRVYLYPGHREPVERSGGGPDRPLGLVVAVEGVPDNRVRVTIDMDDGDEMAVVAHGCVQRGEMGVGLDATIMVQGEVITRILDVACLSLVAMDPEPLESLGSME